MIIIITRRWQATMACRERRRRRPPSWNGLALLSLLSNLPPLSYDGLSHTSRTFRKKLPTWHPLKKWTCPTALPATPQLMDSAALRAHFGKKFPNLTPLVKMDSPYCHYFPTCHPSAIMDSATLVGDALSQCNDNWQLSLHCLSVAVMHMHIASWICIIGTHFVRVFGKCPIFRNFVLSNRWRFFKNSWTGL